MPIDFPPPPTPQQGDLAALHADSAAGAVAVDIGIYVLRVFAPGIFTEAEIRSITAGTLDLSRAVRLLNAAAQNKGVVAPRTQYVRDGDDIYVSIRPGTLAAVEAPRPLQRYFTGLVGEEPLLVGDFEKRRLLGGVHAARMGADFTPVFTPAPDGGYRMTLKRNADVVSSGAARVNFSNFGNRFTGREFLDLDARQGTRWGDEFSAQARTAATLTGIDDVEPGNEYNELQLGWNRVTPYGLVGVSARMIDYRQQFSTLAFNGQIKSLDFGYTGIVVSNASQRLTVQARADYVEKRLEFAASGILAQLEPYGSLELGTVWTASFRVLGQGLLSQASLAVRRGLGDWGPERTNSDLDYWLLRPGFSLRTLAEGFAGELQVLSQLAQVAVPEQQQWVVGGIGSLHAYVPGVAIGDRGLSARLIGEAPALSVSRFSLKPRLFLEWGAAEYSDPASGQPPSRQSVSDAGGELVLGIGPFFEAALAAAMPLHDSGIERRTRDDARADFLFRLSGKF